MTTAQNTRMALKIERKITSFSCIYKSSFLTTYFLRGESELKNRFKESTNVSREINER